MFKLALFCLSLTLAWSLLATRHATPQATAAKPGRKYTTLERLQQERLRAVKADRVRYQRARKAVALGTGLHDYRAILHAHAEDSTHTGGTRPELLTAAQQTGVQIVLLSDHVRPPRDFINDSWRGLRDGVLFIPGAESEGFLVYPQRSIIGAHINKSFKTPGEYVRLVKEGGGNIFLSHVEEKLDWTMAELDGLEIYNHHTDLIDEDEFVKWLRGSFTNLERLRQFEALLREFPQEVFGALQDYLPSIIAKWDRELQTQRLTGVAANDCHHNQVFTIKAVSPDAIEVSIIGDATRRITVAQAPSIAALLAGRIVGDQIARLDLDPYERSLSYVTTHILAGELEEQAVRQALRQSRAYVAHDWLCDPTGFAFIAEKDRQRQGVMGDEVRLEPGLQLRLAAPVSGLIKLFRNGQVVHETKADKLDFAVREVGIYRAEIWLEIDSEQRPWIYANPIRVLQRR